VATIHSHFATKASNHPHFSGRRAQADFYRSGAAEWVKSEKSLARAEKIHLIRTKGTTLFR